MVGKRRTRSKRGKVIADVMGDGRQRQDTAVEGGKAIVDAMGDGRRQQDSAHKDESAIAQHGRR